MLYANKSQGLPTLCETRWLSRVDSLSTLLVKYDQIKNALEDIFEDSTGQSKSDSRAYLKKMSNFLPILTAVMTQHTLAFVRPLSVALQSRQCDLVEAYEECQTLTKSIKKQSGEFHKLFVRATTVLKTTYGEGEEPDIPRSVAGKRQAHRANAPSTSAEEFYKVNHYYPFVDHVVSHLQTRFPNQLKGALLAYYMYLTPKKLSKLTKEIEQSIKEEFMNDLPMPHNFEQEISRWKHEYSTLNTANKDLVDIVNMTNQTFYPNIYTILTLLLTLPVGSCTCERSFSALRRSKTWCRTSTGEDRLNGLALCHIHKDHPLISPLDPLEVLKQWDASLHRKIALPFDHSQDGEGTPLD